MTSLMLPTGVTIRPLASSDRDAVRQFLGRLSPQSIRRRFFLPLPSIADHVVAPLVDVDHETHEALVALVADEVVALASYHRNDAGGATDTATSAEADVVVQDDWQRQGLASALLDDLSVSARQGGITQLTATVLAENGPMLALLRKIAPRSRRVWHGPEIGVDINLTH
ncbi:MAG TPA: GNAT family N-acetyltransferase [Acidimicrobiales bacterium]|nr:GNAT family N-acetyltransferase [Acidimicrobiales bacterium]